MSLADTPFMSSMFPEKNYIWPITHYPRAVPLTSRDNFMSCPPLKRRAAVLYHAPLFRLVFGKWAGSCGPASKEMFLDQMSKVTHAVRAVGDLYT